VEQAATQGAAQLVGQVVRPWGSNCNFASCSVARKGVPRIKHSLRYIGSGEKSAAQVATRD